MLIKNYDNFIRVPKKYLIPILVFIVSSIYFISMTSSVGTFFNVASDAPLFLIAAKYLRLGHPSPGSPLYHLLNAGWLQIIPIASDYYSLAIFNALCSAGVATTLYLITKKILAPLIWMSAGVVVTQSTILEQYAMCVLFLVVSYWLYTKDKRSFVYAVASFGVMVNHLAGIAILVYLANDLYNHRNIKPFLWTFVSLPLLLSVPIVNRPPYLMIGGASFKDYWDYFSGARFGGGLVMGLAIIPMDDFLQRGNEFLRIFLGSLGVAFFIAILAIKKYWKESFVLPMLFIFPTFYWFTNLDPATYTYTVVSIAFATLLVCKYNWKLGNTVCTIGCVLLIFLNYTWYDLGRTLDPYNSQQIWYEELDKLEPGAVLQTNTSGMATLWVMMNNLENGTEIVNIIREVLHSTLDQRPALVEKVLEAEEKGILYETVIVDNETYFMETYNVTSSDIVKWIVESPWTLGNSQDFDYSTVRTQ